MFMIMRLLRGWTSGSGAFPTGTQVVDISPIGKQNALEISYTRLQIGG